MTAPPDHLRAVVAVVAFAMTACGCGVSGVTNGVVANMEGVRISPTVRDGAAFAPQEFAMAENQRTLAQKASREGDEVAASLYAAQAVAGYTDAVVLARLVRATIEQDRASSDLTRDEARAEKLATERVAAESRADELAKKLKLAELALIPARSSRADPAREAARLVAARALVAEARLLCGAARLLSPSLEGIDALDENVAALDGKLESLPRSSPAPIDDASRIRAECLELLTRARRTSDPSQDAEPDALLSELSASGQFEPSRDERGVVILLRNVFRGSTLSTEASKALTELGRVAAAHPGFAVQVVVHDAVRPTVGETSVVAQRVQSAVAALVTAGALPSHVKGETMGDRVPLVDPRDAAHRARNARVEVVFVNPSS